MLDFGLLERSELTIMSGLGAGIKENGRREGFEEGSFSILLRLVRNGLLSIEEASKSVALTVEEFREKEIEFRDSLSYSKTNDTSASSSNYDHVLDSMGLKYTRNDLLDSKTNRVSTVYGIEMTKDFLDNLTELTSLSLILKEEGRREGFMEGTIKTLSQLINEGKLTIGDAAETAGMTVDELLEKKEVFERLNS